MRLFASAFTLCVPRPWHLMALLWLVLLVCTAGCPGTPGQDEAEQSTPTSETSQEAVPTNEPSPTDAFAQEVLPEATSQEAAPEKAPQDAGTPEEAAQETLPEGPQSRCTERGLTMTCEHNTAVLQVGLLSRTVYWQTPLGTPPPEGWPVAIMFQGSLYSSKFSWVGVKNGVFGIYNQVSSLKELLDAGYAVLTPVVKGAGTTFWDTNIPPYAYSWTLSADHAFMLKIFEDMEQGVFGRINTKKMYAFGISSGGYMTSRMAVAYPGKFRALAIHSGSYASCAGPVCAVPTLPKDHPPTLFLHGTLDPVVPVVTMYPYRDKLKKQGTPQRIVEDPLAAHEWISAAPQAIVDWFQKHP